MKKLVKKIKKVYRYGYKIEKNIFLELLGSLIGITISIAFPLLAAKQIVYLTDKKFEQLVLMSIVMMILGFFDAIKSILIRKNTQIISNSITENIQKSLGNEILKITQTDLDNNNSGTFVQRMTADTEELSHVFTIGVGRLVRIISNIGVFISVFIISRPIFFFYLATTGFLTIFHIKKSNKYATKDKEKREQAENVSGLTSELVRGARDVKMLNAKDDFLETLSYNIRENNRRYIAMRNIDINYNFVITIFTSVFEFLLMLLLINLIINKSLTVPMALALFAYKGKVMNNFMENISNLLEEIKNFDISYDRVFSIIDKTTFNQEIFGTKHLDKVEGNFEFKNVNFSYNKNQVLKDLSFKIKANEIVGLVGKSGSGKTTIFNLLCKMYNKDSGTITIDDIDIDQLDEDSIRGNITIISQNPYIFNMSIKDNFKLVKRDVTDEEMIRACKLSCIDDFINTLPDKYDTVIGEGGVNLSGGQKQRIAIARAFIQKTEIILFDEATSALDNETQKEVQKAINNLKGEYTIIIIAHRLSTIENCDKIMVLEDGHIVNEGTHKELLETSNIYKKLYKTELDKEN